jgi:cell division cycle 20-like protein 1 (cofactor of APC complex)
LGGKVLKYKQPKKERFEYNFDSTLINTEQMFINSPATQGGEQAKPRKIAPNPYRILDAPGLQDDFYLNLVDWSAQNILAVALESSVYVWNATTSTVEELCDVGLEDQVTSLSWSN